jgi:hypothetical protein
MDSTINKIQINSSVDTDQSGKVIKKSLLINIRCDLPSEAISLFQDLQSRLNGSKITFDSNELRYEGLPFDEPVKAEQKAITATPTCPRCGKVLKQRSGARGSFYGCNYPTCTYTQPL